MAASIVQSKKGYFSGNSTTATFDSNVTAGNTILVTLHAYDAPEGISSPVTDSLSNSYSRKFHATGGDGALVLSFNFADNITGGACTVTINPEGTGAYCSYMIIEIGGVDAAPDDGADTNTGTGTAVTAGPLTPTVSGDILLAGMTSMAGGQVAITPDGDYTQLDEYENGASFMHMNVQYRVYNSTAADTANWTIGSSQGWIGGMMAFKAAAGATTITVAEGSVSVSGDAVTVGVTRNLTVAEGAVACAGDAVTLNYGILINLPVGEGNVSVTGDAVTLGVTRNLAVGEGTVSISGDAVTVDFNSGATLTVSTPVPYRVFQRSGTTGTIAITGTYTGTPAAIEASFNGGAYQTIVASPAGGTFSGSLTGQAQGQGTLTVRFTNETGAADTVAYVGIGDVFICAGQSNAVGMTAGNQSYSHPTLKAGLFGNDYNWKELADPVDAITNQVDTVSRDGSVGGSYYPLFATHWMANTGVPVAFVPCALTGSRILEWQPGANHQDRTTLYGSMVYRALQTGARLILFWQGESDVTDGLDLNTYNAYLDSFANAVMTDLGIKVAACTLEDLSVWFGGFDEAPLNAKIVEAWNDNENVIPGADFRGIQFDSGDAHYSLANAPAVALNWYYAVAGIEFAGGSVTVTGDAVTLSVGQGATSLTVAEGSVSASGDAVTLGVTGNLTVGEGSAATTGDAVTVGVLHPLSVAEGSVSVSGDAVTVTFTGPTWAVTVGEGAVTTLGDAATFGVLHPLAVGEGTVATTGDAVTLNFGLTVSLTVAEGAVSASGDPATLGVLSPLTVGEGAVSLTGDAITLGVTHLLSVGEGAVTTSGDPVTVSFSGIGTVNITLAEGAVATSGDAVTVGVLHPLTVAEGAVTSLGDAVTLTFTGPTWGVSITEGAVSTTGDGVTVGVLHPLTVGEGAVGVGGDPVTITIAALILAGARGLYRPGTRTNHEASIRGIHRVPTRGSEDVDD